MTPEQGKILLGQISLLWNDYNLAHKVPVGIYDDNLEDFRKKIHDLQRHIVMEAVLVSNLLPDMIQPNEAI